MSTIQQPTESELQILQVLWATGPCTVRQVNEQINHSLNPSDKNQGYTTTLKLMQIMTTKSLVIRDTSNRTHIYAAACTEEDTQSTLLQSFVDKAFKGSAASLVMQALGDHQASKAELSAIKNLIVQLEKKSKS